MITKQTELKIYGILMIFFGLLDIGNLCLDISEVNLLLVDYSKTVAIVTYVFFALCGLMSLAKFWMGRQALRYVKGKGKGTSHILLAKIGIVFGVLVLASDAFAMFNGATDTSEVISSITSLIIIYSYYSAAKACL